MWKTSRKMAVVYPIPKLEDQVLPRVRCHQYLSVWFDSRLNFGRQVQYLRECAAMRVRMMKAFVTQESLLY